MQTFFFCTRYVKWQKKLIFKFLCFGNFFTIQTMFSFKWQLSCHLSYRVQFSCNFFLQNEFWWKSYKEHCGWSDWDVSVLECTWLSAPWSDHQIARCVLGHLQESLLTGRVCNLSLTFETNRQVGQEVWWAWLWLLSSYKILIDSDSLSRYVLPLGWRCNFAIRFILKHPFVHVKVGVELMLVQIHANLLAARLLKASLAQVSWWDFLAAFGLQNLKLSRLNFKILTMVLDVVVIAF